ncbi:hypothetical protein [Erysipelothrix sp. P66]|uniref:hypothetical protein n=1 Tax=Erysipelothrix sp. P66 TaxID=3141531 RepID=UPI00315C68F6
MIYSKNGKEKQYIYKTDIKNYLACSYEHASRIFDDVKKYEIETLEFEMFENRVPQKLFHEWRNKKKKRCRNDKT